MEAGTFEKKEAVLLKYRIFESNTFLDDLDNIAQNHKKKIYNKIHNYAYPQLILNPYHGKNIRKLINYDPPTWRYRIGDYRIFYEIDQDKRIIYIIAIEIRHKAY